MTTQLFRHFIWLHLLLGLLSCHSSQKEKNVLLVQADSLMQTCPDSALSLLESIPNPQLLPQAHRAEYALLLTQAKHKNYVTLDNDSLIKTAVDYYKDGDDGLREALAYFYLGSTYRDMGDMTSTINAYLKALEVLPEKSDIDFLTKVYNNLADCYEQQDLYKVALNIYKRAYNLNVKLCRQENILYSVRGIANVFLYESQLDSAFIYYQKALDIAQSLNDSTWISTTYMDLASVYNERKDYDMASECISKVTCKLGDITIYYRLKARIFDNQNELDSAHYYFALGKETSDLYVKTSCYNGLYEIEKKLENWKVATLYVDSFILLYDSIQGLSERAEVDKLMDNHLLEKHKSLLSSKHRQTMIIIGGTLSVFIIVGVFLLMWIDRRRKTKYIILQQQLMQSRVDDMQMEEESIRNNIVDTNKHHIFRERQLEICIELFRTTDYYKKIGALEHATLREQKNILRERQEMYNAVLKTFIDVIQNLRDCCPALTNDDLFYCVLSLNNCSKEAIMGLMDISPDALKTRKNRVKNKIDAELFNRIFSTVNH